MKPIRSPIIPGTPKDRTGAQHIIRRAEKEIDRRFDGLLSDVVAVFESISTYRANEVSVVYGFTTEELQRVSQALDEALQRWIETGRTPESFWWYGYEDEASRLGVAQSVANLSKLSEVYAATRTLQTIIYSAPYRNRMAVAQFKSYEHWTGLQAQAKTELSQIIGRAVVDGKNPRAVVTEIAERLDVTRSRAKQYAQTDITDTLRQARWAEADDAEQALGMRIEMLWTSALKPTTRHWHASRNGKAYTTAEVREFYSNDGNRYNCYCSQTECLVDSKGKPILTDIARTKLEQQRVAWLKAYGTGKKQPS